MEEVKTLKNFEVVFVLDRSGSMGCKEDDTIGGFNSLLDKQKELPGNVKVTTVLFDDEVVTLHDRMELGSVPAMTKKDYFVRGCTAMWDAVGSTIQRISHLQDMESQEDKSEKTLFIITTDGMENASTEYTGKQVRNLIESRKKDGWEFMFLGANIDAEDVAEDLGIDRDMAVEYENDGEGVSKNYAVLGNVISCVRSCKGIKDDWKDDIESHRKSKKQIRKN